MKKMTKRFLMMLMMMLTLFFIVEINVNAAASWTTTGFAQRDLGYGVTLDIYEGTSKSSFNSTTQYEDRYQKIYTANISKDSPARVVQWTRTPTYDNTWANYTLAQIAEDYEEKHPGQKVLVATNNWLSDTTSENVGELDGAQVSGGLNYRVSDKQGVQDAWVFHETYGYIPRPAFLGFDASGKKAYFTNDWNNGENYTDKLMLSFFNGYSQERTMLNMAVDKINEAPDDGEIAIYFKNFDGGIQTFDDAVIYKMDGSTLRYDSIPGTDFVQRDAFAMGTLNSIVSELDSGYGQNIINRFHIVSRNDEFNALDLSNKTLVAQYELLGDFTNVIGGTTYYGHIIRDGECYPGSFGHWNEINCEVHPRTAFIIKKDGTFALSVIDGRQRNLTGMDYEDMANFYKVNYDGYNVFNYDGGGSSAMAVAKQGGGFEIVNSPSDGNQRRVGNATMIVVDKEPFDITQNTRIDTTITLEINNIDASVSKIFVTLNDVTKEVTDGKVKFENLNKCSNYDLKFTYEQNGSQYVGSTYQGQTSDTLASMSYFKQSDATQNSVTLKINITNPGGNFSRGLVEIDGKTVSFKEEEVEVTVDGLKYSTEYECKITVYSKTGMLNDQPIEYVQSVKTKDAKYVEKIYINNEKTTLNIGEELELVVTTYPENVGGRLTYESSDENVVAVRSGKVIGVGAGTATITISTREGLSEEITFTVLETTKTDEKGGCKKDLGIYLIPMLSLGTAALYIFKKRK